MGLVDGDYMCVCAWVCVCSRTSVARVRACVVVLGAAGHALQPKNRTDQNIKTKTKSQINGPMGPDGPALSSLSVGRGGRGGAKRA